MLLAAEIKAAQELERQQHDFLVQNAPENIKVGLKARFEMINFNWLSTSNNVMDTAVDERRK